MEFFVISLLNGLSYGLLLFMLSSGLTLIFSMMGVLNFAHASERLNLSQPALSLTINGLEEALGARCCSAAPAK